MGTRRSKHHKGRKPLYKDHGTESVRHFNFDAEPTQPREKIVPTVRNRRARPTHEVELAESVARWLANRPKQTTPDFADQPVPLADVPERRAYCIDHLQSDDGGKLVTPSERDILLQLYVERKISALQLRAGRAWQWDMEAAAIQPNASIDWSSPRRGLHYQARGDLTERQYSAMMRRRDFADAMGIGALRMLDYCLDVDRGRAELVLTLQCAGRKVDGFMRDLLDNLAAARGADNLERKRWVWRAKNESRPTTVQLTTITSRKSWQKIPVTFSQPRRRSAA